MKTYSELNLEEKSGLEKIIKEIIELLPKDNTYFESEKKNDEGKLILKTKQDYNEDKNTIIQIIEQKRQEEIIDKQKSKEMKIAITILFNEFIRISPRKIYQITKEKQLEEDEKETHKKPSDIENMIIGKLYIKVQGTFIELPEKVLYKVCDIPENSEMQTLQYMIMNDGNIENKANNKTNQRI